MNRRTSERLVLLLLVATLAITSPLAGFAKSNSVMKTYVAGSWGTQTFLCETRLAVAECNREVDILKSHLEMYPTAQLGAWTWVLIPADHWQDLARDLGLDSSSPAYTCIEDRLTLIDESMLAQKDAGRNAELLRKFEMPLPKLIDFAVTHEMGHALCGFKDEYKAEAVGRRLREGELPYCSVPSKVHERFPITLQADVWGGTRAPLGTGTK